MEKKHLVQQGGVHFGDSPQAKLKVQKESPRMAWTLMCFSRRGDHNLVSNERKLKMRRKHLAVGVSLVLMVATLAMAQPPPQDKEQASQPSRRPKSPSKGKKITIEYGRPYLKGRKVGQELAPYGKVWRTGADEATALTTEVDLNIGGVKMPAGKYTLYTLPSEGTWKLIINKETGQWGTKYDEGQDLAR